VRNRSRHIVVTGAGGYIGSRLASRLATDPAFALNRLTLVDTRFADGSEIDRVRRIEGDLADAHTLDAVFSERPDTLIHLAGVLGGAAEAAPDLARRVNIDATLDLLDRARNETEPPRMVFASSIAVFGPPLPEHIDDSTMPVATMLYGAQKRMMEIAIEQASARGWIDGLAVRLPGIVARPDADARLRSAFLNTIFYDYAAGKPISLPVSPDGTTWLISVPACVDALVHAILVPGGWLGRRRAFTLPAQRIRIADLVGALARRFPDSSATVTYMPDEMVEAQFARQPSLATPFANALGFAHDGDIDRLVERAFAG